MKITIKAKKMGCGGATKKMQNGGDPKKPSRKDVSSSFPKAPKKPITIPKRKVSVKIEKKAPGFEQFLMRATKTMPLKPRPLAKMAMGGGVGDGKGLKSTKSSTDCWTPGGGSKGGNCGGKKGRTSRGGGHPDLVPVKKKTTTTDKTKTFIPKFESGETKYKNTRFL